jgi:hypothetical protein
MKKILIVDMKRLCRARAVVTRELRRQGIWNSRLQKINVYLTLAHSAYGVQFYGGSGHIHIPRLSIARVRDWVTGNYVSLRDVIRHEYGHAVAHVYRSLVLNRSFIKAFGRSHDSERESTYSPDRHVSEYAASSAAEDFAECVMFYLKHNGNLPPGLDTPMIRRKWAFIARLRSRVRRIR